VSGRAAAGRPTNCQPQPLDEPRWPIRIICRESATDSRISCDSRPWAGTGLPGRQLARFLGWWCCPPGSACSMRSRSDPGAPRSQSRTAKNGESRAATFQHCSAVFRQIHNQALLFDNVRRSLSAASSHNIGCNDSNFTVAESAATRQPKTRPDKVRTLQPSGMSFRPARGRW
jgi:hypothetical protein